MNNPMALHINIIHPLPDFDMSGMHPQKAPSIAGPKTGAIGIKGPWHLDPGNPDFPNHRPYLTNPKAPNEMATPPSQKFKTT